MLDDDEIVVEVSQQQQNCTFDGSFNSTVSYSKLMNNPVIPKELEVNKDTVGCSSAVEQHIFGNQIIDMNILGNVFNILLCPECSQRGLQLCQITKQGVAMKLHLHCSCGWGHIFWTSEKPKNVRSFDVNKRIFYSMRRIGKGYNGLKTFLMLMNLPPPMTYNGRTI